jgi:hypothetical protein
MLHHPFASASSLALFLSTAGCGTYVPPMQEF